MATPRKKGSRETPPKERRIEVACMRWSDEAVNVLSKALLDDSIDIRWRIQAAKELLDRGFGRPRQQVDQTIKVEAAEALLQALMQKKD